MRKMRSNRSSPVAPVAPAAAEGAAAMTMAQMAEMMRALQATVEASRVEQARMHEDLVASRARNEELSKMTEELRQALQEQQGRSAAEEVAPSSPPRAFPMPFIQAITDTPIPTSVVPVKAVFTGVEDPEAHLTTFHTQMILSGGSDAVYCKMFVSTLQGTAMEWFVSLPNGHITNFQQFSKIFVEQYIVNKAPPRVSYDLFDIRQYQGESLREYLNRFGAQMVRSPAKDEEMLVYAFKKGVQPGPFREALIRAQPATFAEVRRLAVAHIADENEVAEKRGSEDPARPGSSRRGCWRQQRRPGRTRGLAILTIGGTREGAKRASNQHAGNTIACLSTSLSWDWRI